MQSSIAHHYRGYLVEVGTACTQFGEKFCGEYLVTGPGGEVVGEGETPVMLTVEMAEKVALSLALVAVDKKLREHTNANQGP